MPTALRIDGFIFTILLPPREHRPAHVHIGKAGTTVVVELGTLRIRKNTMSNADTRAAVRHVIANADALLNEWRKYHG